MHPSEPSSPWATIARTTAWTTLATVVLLVGTVLVLTARGADSDRLFLRDRETVATVVDADVQATGCGDAGRRDYLLTWTTSTGEEASGLAQSCDVHPPGDSLTIHTTPDLEREAAAGTVVDVPRETLLQTYLLVLAGGVVTGVLLGWLRSSSRRRSGWAQRSRDGC